MSLFSSFVASEKWSTYRTDMVDAPRVTCTHIHTRSSLFLVPWQVQAGGGGSMGARGSSFIVATSITAAACHLPGGCGVSKSLTKSTGRYVRHLSYHLTPGREKNKRVLPKGVRCPVYHCAAQAAMPASQSCLCLTLSGDGHDLVMS